MIYKIIDMIYKIIDCPKSLELGIPKRELGNISPVFYSKKLHGLKCLDKPSKEHKSQVARFLKITASYNLHLVSHLLHFAGPPV